MATKPNQEDQTLASLPADRQQIVVQVQVSEVGAPGCIREKLHAYLIYSGQAPATALVSIRQS